jgi:predicted porin
MKEVIVTCAIFVSVPAAHAQSSITLYGIIDEGFEAISNAPASPAARAAAGCSDSMPTMV